MSTKTGSILAAISGILGAVMLIASFSLNAGPPSDVTTSAQLIAFDTQNFNLILWGAWLQAIGPVFIVLFAFTIVSLAGATTRIAGWMTIFGATTLMTVSLIEIVFYISALNNNPATMALISYELIHAVQHLYFIVAAPALFLPLGIVILGSDILPRLLGYLALVLGAAFALAGVLTLLSLIVPVVVQASASIQVIWWLATAITLIVRAGKISASVSVKEQAIE
jgi:hypothetical protein